MNDRPVTTGSGLRATVGSTQGGGNDTGAGSSSGGPDRPPPKSTAIDYSGRGGELAGITVANTLLTILTLGIYRFWAKTRVRRYLWSHVSFHDSPLEYTGRGIELFLGFIAAVVILTPLIVVPSYIIPLLDLGLAVSIGFSVFQGVVVLLLIQVAVYRAWRYRLSRTQWRGVRAGLDGSSFAYAQRAFLWTLASVVTLGLAVPWANVALHRYRLEHTWFGSKRFSFDGNGRALMIPWLFPLLTMAVTIAPFIPIFMAIDLENGPDRSVAPEVSPYLALLSALGGTAMWFVYLWYRVRQARYLASCTTFGGLSFRFDLKTRSVVGRYVLYWLAMVGVYFVVFAVFMIVSFVFAGVVAALGAAIDPENPFNLQVLPIGLLATGGVIALVLFIGMLVVQQVLQAVLFINPLSRVVCENLTVIGEEDFDAIAQSAQARPGRGEGLAEMFDVGAI
ncbi:MAG: YjgN family protein [Kiloniellales bacterium]